MKLGSRDHASFKHLITQKDCKNGTLILKWTFTIFRRFGDRTLQTKMFRSKWTFFTSYVRTGTFINPTTVLVVQTIHMVSNIYSYNMPLLNWANIVSSWFICLFDLTPFCHFAACIFWKYKLKRCSKKNVPNNVARSILRHHDLMPCKTNT